MKLRIIWFLVAVIPSMSFGEEKPIFTLLQERLDNSPPRVSITFPDGHTDNLILRDFYAEEIRPNGCYYSGHLERDTEACVGMTGCIGSEDVEFTILSDHATDSGSYKWSKNGSVELIPIPKFHKYGEKVKARDGGYIDKEIFDPVIDAAEEIIEKFEENSRATVPNNMKLKIGVAYDDSLKSKLGSESACEDYWNSAHVHVQTRYCHSTLGSKIKIERSGSIKHMPGKNIDADYDPGQGWNIDHVYDMGEYTRDNIGERDLMVYMCFDDNNNGDGYIGEATLSTVCLPNSEQYRGRSSKYAKLSINEYMGTPSEFGALVAHEIGHNLGMHHDHASRHQGKGCSKDENIMSYGSGPYKWSHCSVADFKAHYTYVTSSSSWCMDALSTDPCSTQGSCTGTCKHQSWKADGYCDDENNNCGCEWDGGDCCGSNVDKKYCSVCACLDPNAAAPCTDTCSKQSWKGDNWCDDGNNNCGCEWDGGDCCGSNVRKSYCSVCACLDPNQAAGR